MTTDTFKVGDMVRIVGSAWASHNGLVREVLMTDGARVLLDTPKGQRWLWIGIVEMAEPVVKPEDIHF